MSTTRASLWAAAACATVALVSAIALALPTYGALRADNGVTGACLIRHSQSTGNTIQDLPTTARVDWVRATLQCDWPLHGGGTHRTTFEFASESLQLSSLCLGAVGASGAVIALAHAGRRMRSATANG